MTGLSYAEAEFLAAFEEQNAAMRAEARDLVAKSDELLCSNISAAWQAIEHEADRLVQKSSEPLRRERAIDRVLRTPKGAALYADYVGEQDRVRTALELAEGAASRRAIDESVREKTTAAVQKTADGFGYGAAEEHARELLADEAVARAFGGHPVEPVEKTSRVWDEIERRASALVEKGDEGLSQAQAIERVLRDHPHLYGRYMADVEAGWVALAKADGGPGLNTGESVAGPERIGSASSSWSTTSTSAREVLADFIERLEAAQARGEDAEEFLARQDAPVRQLVEAVLESAGEPPNEDDAALERREAELWDEIVTASGAAPRSPEFSRTINSYLETPAGQKHYGRYVQAYEARGAALAR